jgi:hypothetical protein
MEVSGDYNLTNSDGSINTLPRQEIAKEFFKTHSDEYDFLVIFSNFDFTMSQSDAKAYYLEIKNDAQGIGKSIFDDSTYYGSNSKLQGIIDMGNISNHIMDSTQSGYEDTVLLLTHEFMHRWGASVKFKDTSGNTSTSLLANNQNHWSYLLDSDASVLYGNDWQDNGDGTFTSLGARKYLSSLDLYLMGIYDKSQVSEMLLIENTSIDSTTLPSVGTTISGTAKYITIDDIISAEGERVPDTSTSQKTFKVGYILITTPNTFTGDETTGIENIRNSFAGKVSSLTYGEASISDVTPLLSITITSPSNGETINKPKVMVKGTITNSTGNETGVTVNGVIATVYGNEFIANNVSLSEGSNTITATATDTAGNTASTSISITASTTGNYITLTSNIESGISPLETTLKIDGSFTITSSTISVTGPTQPEFLSTTSTEAKVKMTVEGIYYFTASVTDENGNTYTDTIAITVMNKTQLDTLLKKKWEGMKNKLSVKDVESGVSYFFDYSKETYRQAFNIIIDDLPQIISDMQNVELIYLTEDVAKYRINRVQDIDGTQQTITYYIYFAKDADGIWKIDKF